MFTNIQDYYDYLEADHELKNNLELSKGLMLLRDSCQTEELKLLCNYELFFNDFAVQEGQLKPKLVFKDGIAYPNFSLFTDNLDYIRGRAENTLNSKYKAKYYHLLWCSPIKHIEYAKLAIEQYFNLIDSVVLPVDDLAAHIAFETVLKNVFVLTQNINYKKNEATNRIGIVITSGPLNTYRKSILIEFILKMGKKTPKASLEIYYNFFVSVIASSSNIEPADRFLKLLISLAQRLNISSNVHFGQLGDYYRTQGEAKTNFVSHDFYIKALKAYQKSGNKEKMESTSVLIENAKKTMEFKSIKVENSSEKLQEWCKFISSMTDKLTEDYLSKEIYQHIILFEHIFPNAEALEDNASPDIFKHVTVMTFDLNKNISGKSPAGLNAYELHIKNFTLSHLQQIFYKGITKGKITSKSFLEYLSKYSWYGIQPDEGGFNWLNLLSPSIKSFFHQSEIDIRERTNNHTEYILCVDSLLLKFEGLLREFSRRLGAQTIEIKEGGTEERISFEKLLDNPKLTAVIPRDDIALFKFLFTAEHMNLRNNIAHCFYRPEQYSAGLMFLLISALLKLGDYSFSSD